MKDLKDSRLLTRPRQEGLLQVLWDLIPPNIGKHLALPYKKSAGKPCVLSEQRTSKVQPSDADACSERLKGV